MSWAKVWKNIPYQNYAVPQKEGLFEGLAIIVPYQGDPYLNLLIFWCRVGTLIGILIWRRHDLNFGEGAMFRHIQVSPKTSKRAQFPGCFFPCEEVVEKNPPCWVNPRVTFRVGEAPVDFPNYWAALKTCQHQASHVKVATARNVEFPWPFLWVVALF